MVVLNWSKEVTDTISNVKGGHTSWHSLKKDQAQMSDLLLLFKD
jgi:hypothetical protein